MLHIKTRTGYRQPQKYGRLSTILKVQSHGQPCIGTQVNDRGIDGQIILLIRHAANIEPENVIIQKIAR